MGKRKRGHGEGSIFRRPDGRWCASVTVGYDAQGRQRKRYVYGRTRQEVAEKLARLLAEKQKGPLADPTRETVAQFLERWLRDSVKPSVRPRTYEAYASIVRCHLAPAFARVKLTQLTPAHVQELYVNKLAEGRSPKYVREMHVVLHRALEQAVRWGLVPRNVCDAVDRPKAERRPVRALSAEQAARLLDAAREDRLHALYVLALTTGARQGELLGLSWEDVDLEAGRIRIRHQLQHLREKDPATGRGYRPVLVPPKSAKSRRTVELTPLAVAALRQHRARQNQERLLLGEAWGGAYREWNLVFTTELGTPIHPQNLVKRSFLPLLERAGLPRIRFHDLRHTCATLLLEAGEHPKVVQEMLGHASVTLTLDTYSHVAPSLQKAAAAKMQAILAAAQAKQ